MTTLAHIALGFGLGLFAAGMLVALIAAFRAPAPTKHRRRYRDSPLRGYQPVGDMPPPPGPREDGVRYEWINLTGEER
jgi:hypothetical protein